MRVSRDALPPPCSLQQQHPFPSFVLVLSTLTCGPAMCPTAAVWEGKGTGLGRVAEAEVAGKVLGPRSVA